MGWEERSGRQYYYRKRREGQRVISEYIGTGEFAELAATLDALIRMEREAELEVWRQEREAEQKIVAEMEKLAEAVRVLTAAALLGTGHRTHKGQWRRKRE